MTADRGESEPEDALADAVRRLTIPAPPLDLGGAKAEYALVLVKPRVDPIFSDWTWQIDIPELYLAQESDRRAFATAMRDFLRERGHDVRLVARTTLVDEVG